MIRRVAAVALVIFSMLGLIAPASAQAPSPLAPKVIRHWMHLARKVWPNVCWPPSFGVFAAQPGSRIVGWAWIGGNPCHFELREDWPTWPAGMLCTIIVHEMGHLAGQRHSTNRRSVMYPDYIRVFHRCPS